MSKAMIDEYHSTTPRETAPSVMRADEPRFARLLGTIGLFLVVLSGAVMLVPQSGVAGYIGPFWRTVLMTGGIAFLLYHAVRDGDMQVRRAYGVLGFALLGVAAAVSTLPISGAKPFERFLPYGFVFLMLALLFLMAFMRSEDATSWRWATLRVLLLVGAGLALTGLIGGNQSEAFLLPYGLLLASVGLAYLWAFVGIEGTSTDLGYRVAFGLGVVGAITLLAALGRSILPPLFFSWGWTTTRPEPFFVPSGMLLAIAGLIFLALSIGMCSDNRLAVLTRKELASYFYSPMAYLVLFGFGIVGWWMFLQFISRLAGAGRMGGIVQEPIVAEYILSWFPIMFLVILGIPVLTMRSFSEEQRTGTMEVLLTVPVSETIVVLSKFLAVFVFYLLTWLPWAMFLISLRVESGQAFEYRPLLSFLIALACSGAGFLAMGLFFSSLTKNQMVAAVLTAVGMLFFTSILIIKRQIEQENPGSIWANVLHQMSYLDLWIISIGEGSIAPKLLLFHLTAAVFWLFLTVKVLESRKWR